MSTSPTALAILALGSSAAVLPMFLTWTFFDPFAPRVRKGGNYGLRVGMFLVGVAGSLATAAGVTAGLCAIADEITNK